VQETRIRAALTDLKLAANSRIMPLPTQKAADELILAFKSEGRSFAEISKRLGKSRGSVAGRYYRLKGVRHPAQIARDAAVKRTRALRRLDRNKQKSSAAIQAAIDLRSGSKFLVVVERARAAGASLEMIGACCGISRQALHKKWRREVGRLSVRRLVPRGAATSSED
jgi:IS30 family transposase